jgi:crotonobetainyl-CoA:carnitine CoA-transferase CaiB-like acyl-CoA transferase
MQEFWEHPQLEARARWRDVGSPAGMLRMMAPPFNLDGFEPRMDPVPALGEHSRKILVELGYSGSDIARLQSEGVV